MSTPALVAYVVARLLLGVIFTVFGANGFLHFIPAQAMPTDLATNFFGALVASRYFLAVAAFQLVAGILFLAGRWVPLALALTAPVIVNILLFHVTMDQRDIAPALVAAVLWCVVFWPLRATFAPLTQHVALRQS